MKIAFVSGVRYGHELLDHLLKNGKEISVIFSYEESKKKFFSDMVSFDGLAKKYGINNIKVNNINDKDNIDYLKELEPDLILVMGWSQILKRGILQIPKIGIWGSHPTELPKFRGRAPIPWTILKNLKDSALTFFWIGEGTDTGDILDQKKFNITENDDATSIYEKITSLGKKMILENLSHLERGEIKKTKQDESKFVEYWEKRTPEDGKIDWTKSKKEIFDLIRATTYPYPGAFTFFKNSKLVIWKAKHLEEENIEAGKIIKVDNDGVKVGTVDGAILIKEISIDNKKLILASDFFSIEHEGELLG